MGTWSRKLKIVSPLHTISSDSIKFLTLDSRKFFRSRLIRTLISDEWDDHDNNNDIKLMITTTQTSTDRQEPQIGFTSTVPLYENVFVTNFEQTQAISFKVEELQCGNWATIVTCEVVSFSGKRSAIAQAARIGSSLSLVVGGMGSATGLKLGGPKPLLNLKVSRSLILIYKFIKLSKILIHAFKY